jgi:hypothetical protein
MKRRSLLKVPAIHDSAKRPQALMTTRQEARWQVLPRAVKFRLEPAREKNNADRNVDPK